MHCSPPALHPVQIEGHRVILWQAWISALRNILGIHLLETRVELITGNISSHYLQLQAARFAEAIRDKSEGLDNCIGFTDGTVIGIGRPSGLDSQLVAYNGHKTKHALKFQAVNSPDGMILHAYGPIEGRRHDWTLYVISGLDEQLPALLNV